MSEDGQDWRPEHPSSGQSGSMLDRHHVLHAIWEQDPALAPGLTLVLRRRGQRLSGEWPVNRLDAVNRDLEAAHPAHWSAAVIGAAVLAAVGLLVTMVIGKFAIDVLTAIADREPVSALLSGLDAVPIAAITTITAAALAFQTGVSRTETVVIIALYFVYAVAAPAVAVLGRATAIPGGPGSVPGCSCVHTSSGTAAADTTSCSPSPALG